MANNAEVLIKALDYIEDHIAGEIMLQTEESILDIALKFGYSNAESFTRGFRKIWGITPSEYRKTRHFCLLYLTVKIFL